MPGTISATAPLQFARSCPEMLTMFVSPATPELASITEQCHRAVSQSSVLLLTCDSTAVCTGFRLHISHTVKPSTVERRHPVELVVAFSRDTPVA